MEIKKHTTYDGYDYYSLLENGKPICSSPSYESILIEKSIEEINKQLTRLV